MRAASGLKSGQSDQKRNFLNVSYKVQGSKVEKFRNSGDPQ